VHSIHKVEVIVKLLCSSGSPIILVFFDQYPIPRGTPSAAAQNTRVVGKVCDFRLKSPSISETVRDRQWLLWNFSRKLYALYRTVTFSTTLTDPKAGFQGHDIFEVTYVKNGASWRLSYCRTLVGNHTESVEWYHFQWP